MKRGFDITGFYPVSRDSTLRLIEFDCVMINRAAIPAAVQELRDRPTSRRRA